MFNNCRPQCFPVIYRAPTVLAATPAPPPIGSSGVRTASFYEGDSTGTFTFPVDTVHFSVSMWGAGGDGGLVPPSSPSDSGNGAGSGGSSGSLIEASIIIPTGGHTVSYHIGGSAIRDTSLTIASVPVTILVSAGGGNGNVTTDTAVVAAGGLPGTSIIPILPNPVIDNINVINGQAGSDGQYTSILSTQASLVFGGNGGGCPKAGNGGIGTFIIDGVQQVLLSAPPALGGGGSGGSALGGGNFAVPRTLGSGGGITFYY